MWSNQRRFSVALLVSGLLWIGYEYAFPHFKRFGIPIKIISAYSKPKNETDKKVVKNIVGFRNITAKGKNIAIEEPPKGCRELLKLDDLHRRSSDCPIYKFTKKTSISCLKNIAKNTGKRTVILFLGILDSLSCLQKQNTM